MPELLIVLCFDSTACGISHYTSATAIFDEPWLPPQPFGPVLDSSAKGLSPER